MCFVHSYAIVRVPWSARLTGRMLYWPCKLSTSLREHYNVIQKIEDTFLIAFTFCVHFSVTLDVFKWQDKDVIVHFSSFTRPYGSFTPLKDMFWRHPGLAISVSYYIVHFKIILRISETQTAFTLHLMSPVTLKEMSPQGLKLCRSNFTLVSWKQIKIMKLN